MTPGREDVGGASRRVNSELILEAQMKGGLKKDDVFFSDACSFICFCEVGFSGSVFLIGNRVRHFSVIVILRIQVAFIGF